MNLCIYGPVQRNHRLSANYWSDIVSFPWKIHKIFELDLTAHTISEEQEVLFLAVSWVSQENELSRETSQSSLSTRDGMSVKKKLSTTSMSRPNSLAKNLNEAKS
ncbi:hypothetical protein Y032_0020g220 [Ancylostoma ceylanicum]|nr:hypothetical protein Y032_0020g220 [Ancylostoma ceylanicum]